VHKSVVLGEVGPFGLFVNGVLYRGESGFHSYVICIKKVIKWVNMVKKICSGTGRAIPRNLVIP
jgi:hypothetical protein